MLNFIGLTLEEMTDWMAERDEPAFRARQLYHHLYHRQCFSFAGMTDFPKDFRERIFQEACCDPPPTHCLSQSQDGTTKYVFSLPFDHFVEAVYIPEPDRTTLCLSTQVGCPMGCAFCATAKQGFLRNLTVGEILGQYLAISAHQALVGKPVNIVFMGMGEPLLNVTAVMKAFHILIDAQGMALSRRGITLSTSGYVPGIIDMGKQSPRPKLAVSLNAVDDETRDALMPINRQWPLRTLLKACSDFPLVPGERVTVEYIMIHQLNDQDTHARKLVRLLGNIRCKINLIPFNPFPGVGFQPPPPERIERFRTILTDAHYTALLRRSRGQDIQAACGQLSGAVQPPPTP